MAEFLRNEDIERKLLLETYSDNAVSSNNDKDVDTDTDAGTNSQLDEDCYCRLCKWEPSSCLVKTMGHLDFWWSQWVENTRGAS
jgi:hypothetical protein